MRMMGRGKDADDLIVAMNHGSRTGGTASQGVADKCGQDNVFG